MTGPGRHAAVFDMDGVLVNNSRFHREALATRARRAFALTDPEFWRQAIGRPVEEAVPRIPGGRFRPRRRRAWRDGRRRSTTRARRRPGPARGRRSPVRALPRPLGVPRALATSAVADSAARILEGIGLAAVFPVQVTAGQVQRGKPEPEVYLTAAAPGVAA